MPKEGKWTPEIINRFWDYVGKQLHSQEICFSNMCGKGIIQFLIESHSLQTDLVALDYGCGPGFLLEHLLEKGLICYGADYSTEQIEIVNNKFANFSTWKGASVTIKPPLPFPDASFDLIVCVEVLEHLMPDIMEKIFHEIYRLLRRNGRALFTTPNNEDLNINKVYCPFCDTKFHRRQHLHSISAEYLLSTMHSCGFNILFCESIDFLALQTPIFNGRWKSWNLHFFVKQLRFLKNYFLDFLNPKPFPNGRAFRYVSECQPNAPHLCVLVKKP
jgi:SAM-dependent methyltransferase